MIGEGSGMGMMISGDESPRTPMSGDLGLPMSEGGRMPLTTEPARDGAPPLTTEPEREEGSGTRAARVVPPRFVLTLERGVVG